MKAEEFIAWLYPAAEKAGEANPVFTVAQAALETGWGISKIGNNLFGITKGSSWNGKTRLVTTTEYFKTGNRTFAPPEKVISVRRMDNGTYCYRVKRLFRDYDTLEEGLEDHNRLLERVYPDAWAYRYDPEKFVEHLQDRVGYRYATASNYVDVMKSIFKKVRKYRPV